jgi:hypothetical protein
VAHHVTTIAEIMGNVNLTLVCFFMLRREWSSTWKALEGKWINFERNYKLEATINDFNSKILQSEDFIAKLAEADKKFERVIDIEKRFYDKSCASKTLIDKVDALQSKLFERDDVIKYISLKMFSHC